MAKFIGTFSVRGNAKAGYWLVDHDKFNSWGVFGNSKDDKNFKTKAEAEEYAQRCHDFKTGRRSAV